MKPVIGVMPLFDEEKDSIWMVPGYMEGIRRAGGIPMILPLVCDEADLRQINSMCRIWDRLMISVPGTCLQGARMWIRTCMGRNRTRSAAG